MSKWKRKIEEELQKLKCTLEFNRVLQSDIQKWTEATVEKYVGEFKERLDSIEMRMPKPLTDPSTQMSVGEKFISHDEQFEKIITQLREMQHVRLLVNDQNNSLVQIREEIDKNFKFCRDEIRAIAELLGFNIIITWDQDEERMKMQEKGYKVLIRLPSKIGSIDRIAWVKDAKQG